MDKFTIPPGYPGKCTPEQLRRMAAGLKVDEQFLDRFKATTSHAAQRRVIYQRTWRAYPTQHLADREQLRRHFCDIIGCHTPPDDYPDGVDRCSEDPTLLFMENPPRWADTPQAKKVVIDKPPSLKELIETKLGPCEPDPMQELRDLVLSEITTAFGDSHARKPGKSDAFAAGYGGSMTSAAPSIAKQITFADIEAFSKYMDDTMSKPQRSWDDGFGHLDTFRFLNAFRFINISPSYQSLPKKETPVNTKPLTITTKTFTYVNGVDVNNYSSAELYDLIAREESKIRALEAIDNKPVMLQQEIARRKDGITALVAHLDSVTAPQAKPVDPATNQAQQ